MEDRKTILEHNRLLQERLEEQCRITRQLENDLDMYRSIFENAVEGIFQTSPEGEFIRANPAIAGIFGHDTPEELIESVNNIGSQIYVNPGSRHIFTKLLKENNATQLFTTQCYRKDGSIIWISINSRAVRNENGKILYYEGFLQDITPFKKAEEALKESEHRYRTAIENSNDGVAIIKGNIHTYVNQKFLEIFGYEHQDQIVGKSVRKTIHPDDRKMVRDYARMHTKGKKGPSRYELRGIRKDGSLIFIEVSVAAITYESDRVILCYLHDISEKKMRELELLTKKKFESVGMLAGGIAHDFNNMLAAIMGNISLAKLRAKKDEAILDFLENAENASIQASELTKRLITFAKGGAPLKRKIDIVDLIRKTVHHSLRGSNVTCTFAIEKSPVIMALDEGQIWQAVHNIILNAREAMPDQGEICISIKTIMIDRENHLSLVSGKYMEISIRDNGTGIASENVARIFDPYFSTKDTWSQKGMGLGLTVCYSIIKSHGGAIRADSIPGTGTTITFYLPFTRNG